MIRDRDSFQSTPPRGRRRQPEPFGRLAALVVSIHASAREATAGVDSPSDGDSFNPRLRAGGDVRRPAPCVACRFQSTPPRGRRPRPIQPVENQGPALGRFREPTAVRGAHLSYRPGGGRRHRKASGRLSCLREPLRGRAWVLQVRAARRGGGQATSGPSRSSTVLMP